MQVNKINNLLELFYEQYEKQNKEDIFLQSLKEFQKKYTWEDVYSNIIKLSEEISQYIKKGERCLLVSENRPEWMISDLSIMLSEGVTVPAYTTYLERDYEYIIDDCTPTVVIVSNKTQYNKLKNIIPKKEFIKKIIIFDYEKEHQNEIILDIKKVFQKNHYDKKKFINLKIQRKDIACIIYTSGTQGNPKGVQRNPKVSQRMPQGIPRCPKELPWCPKGPQKITKSTPKHPPGPKKSRHTL